MDIPGFVKRTMSLGRSFNHTHDYDSEFKRVQAEELLSIANLIVDHDKELAVRDLSDYNDKIRILIDVIKNKDRNFYTASHMVRLTQIREDYEKTVECLKSNPLIVLSKADKGNITVASYRSTIIELRQEHLKAQIDEGKYELIEKPRIIIKKYMENLWHKICLMLGRHIIDNLGGSGANVPGKDLKEETMLSYYGCRMKKEATQFSPGLIFGQLKVHKEKVLFRPIVDNSARLGGPLEKFILEKLNHIP